MMNWRVSRAWKRRWGRERTKDQSWWPPPPTRPASVLPEICLDDPGWGVFRAPLAYCARLFPASIEEVESGLASGVSHQATGGRCRAMIGVICVASETG